MNDTFTNETGSRIFASYLFYLTDSIPSDRFIDKEYQELSKRSLLSEEEVCNENRDH